MKSFTYIISLLLISFFVACGGGGKYGEVKTVMNDYISAQNSYVDAMAKAGSADDVVVALTNFGNEIEKFTTKGADLQKKYPELKKWQKKPPAELEDVYKNLEESSKKMIQIMVNPKLRKLMMDPKVIKASMAMSKKFRTNKAFK